MYFRVYSHCLDYSKNWYAYNDLLFGYPKSGRKHEGSTTFRLFSSEVQKVNIADLKDRDGKQPSHTWFNGKVQKAKEVYAITSFGIFLLALRQQQPSQEWIQSTAYQNIKNIVNTVCLEQLDDNVNDDGLDHARNVEPSPKRARMERQIRLLKEKNDEQETVILSVRAHECLNKIDKSLSIQSPAKITSPRASTSALIKSKEISPQEKKLRIKAKGEQFMKSLNVVAYAYQENINEVIGNLASEGDRVYSDIVMGATDVIFSRLEAKAALDTTLSKQSQSILYQSIRMPHWIYLLLKVRTKISDAGWQTLLNLTQLGCTGVC